MSKIIIAGCGPGSLEYVTPAVRQAVEKAQVLVGASRLLELFPQATAERIVVKSDIPGALERVEQRLATGQIVILVTGDPGLCSLARPVIERFGRENCRVIPGVSSIQAAFASIAVDWLGARILSAHDRIPEVAPSALIKEEKLAVLSGNPATVSWVEELGRTLAASHDIYLCENLTLPDESVRRVTELQTMKSKSIILFIRREAQS
jgi:precorrin-6y C5,15-methyltransferase (decarboxylating) CbiE subunit